MDARKKAQWIVAILIVVVGVYCNTIFAQTVRIYGGEFNKALLDPTGSGSEMTEVAIEVPHHFDITDLNVQINITHTRVFDLQLILEGPTGGWVCLNKYEFNEFFDGENYTGTIFDDEAQASIEDASAPFTGSFKPEAGNLLEIFDGTDAYGTWLLQIYDMWPYNTGTLDSAELIFTIPEPASSVLIVLATFLARTIRQRRK